MKHSNKKNFSDTVVNELEQKNKCKTNASPCKVKLFLLAVSFSFFAAQGFCQQMVSVQNKNAGLYAMNTASTNAYTRLYVNTDKKKENVSDTAECLEIIGNFDHSIKDFKGIYIAKLILDNTVIETQILNTRKPLMFVLKKNMLYSVRVEKEGFIAKTISISTKASDELDEKNAYTFTFETNLLSQEIQGHFEDDDIDFPVALVSYHKDCDCFDYNKEYTASLIQRMVNSLFFGI